MVVAVSVYHCSEQPEEVVHAATMPLVLGGVVLRSTRRVSSPAHWRSWADSLAVIRSRHPPLGRGAHAIFEGSQDDGFRTVELAGGGRWGTPTSSRSRGCRARDRPPGLAARSQLLGGTARQRGVLQEGSVALTAVPTDRVTTIWWCSFAVSDSLSLVCVQLPMWPSTRRQMCAGGDAWSSGFRIGKCSGEDLPRSWRTSSRVEVVVDGLPLRGGAQLAVDTTLVCDGA